ncbi:hypothetical protein EO763_07370 [Pectobacterium odoriferum]|nr:hypothetical protein EO763_07370 [Pectobacterium odoriferum]
MASINVHCPSCQSANIEK